MDSVYSAGRDLFLMARQVASCPLDVSPPSELCCSCERVQAALGVGRSILAAHPQLLPSCGFLSAGLFSSFVPVPPSFSGTAYCPQPQGSWHDSHISGTRLLCRLVTGLGMGQVFSEDAYPVR